MKTDLSVIITAHKEGNLLYATAQSALDAILRLKASFEVSISVLIYLDNANETTKSSAIDLCDIHDFFLIEGNNGDPGLARMDAIRKSEGDYIALLDGDDLWSDNWLLKCWEHISTNHNNNAVLHPEYNLIFGAHNQLVRQGDVESSFFDESFLRITNYWDALCFCKRKIFVDNPYKDNDLTAGFAHEDYLWMCETLSKGIQHILIKDAVHFKRRRAGSVSQVAEEKYVKVQFNNFSYYRDNQNA